MQQKNHAVENYYIICATKVLSITVNTNLNKTARKFMGGVELAGGRGEGRSFLTNVMSSLKHKWYCLVVLCKQDVPSL